MKPHIFVFVILMIQTILSLVWLKLNINAFYVFVAGCFIADFISAIVWSKSK